MERAAGREGDRGPTIEEHKWGPCIKYVFPHPTTCPGSFIFRLQLAAPRPSFSIHCQGIKNTQVRTFYTMPEYESWKDSLGGSTKGWRIKYYKGLGTSTSAEAKEYFAAIDRHRKQFVWNGGFVCVE